MDLNRHRPLGIFRSKRAHRLRFIHLRALRWRILLNAEANLGVWTVFRATMAGYLGNNFLPARAGEVIRSLLISRRSNLSKTYVLTTALSERLMDVIALVLASSIVLMGVHPKPAWMADLSRSMAIVAAIGALTVTVVPHTGNLLQNCWGACRFRRDCMPNWLDFRSKCYSGCARSTIGAASADSSLLTVAIWTCDALSAMVGSRALGLNLPSPLRCCC